MEQCEKKDSDSVDLLLNLIQQKNRQLKTLLSATENCNQGDAICEIRSQLVTLVKGLNILFSEKVSISKETLQITCEIFSSEIYWENQVSSRETESVLQDQGLSIKNIMHDVVDGFKTIENSLHEMKCKLDTADSLNIIDKEVTTTSLEVKGQNEVNVHGSEADRQDQEQHSHKYISSEKEQLQQLERACASNSPTTDTLSDAETDRNVETSLKSEDEKQAVELKHDNKSSELREINDMQETVKTDMSKNQTVSDPAVDNGYQITKSTSPLFEEGATESDNGHTGAERRHGKDTGGMSTKVLPVESEDPNDLQHSCYITAPCNMIQQMTCRIVNDMSPLIITDSEELVSNIIRIQCTDTRIKIPFPITIAIPFSARYRGNYRDIMVKVIDDELQPSYIHPFSTEGTYGGQKGSFAEVKVYKLGIFSVVSCLHKENFTVPRKGLSLKLSMDARISLDYPPGSFSAPVIVQSMVQPIDASLIATLKSKNDSYHFVVSTSPLVHIVHPSTQSFRKPVTVTLPCPPNPNKKKQGEEVEHTRPTSASVIRNTSIHRVRAMSASVKNSRKTANEYLSLLGYKSKEDQWLVMEDVAVRNMQNGLVSFEMTEHFEKFVVLRLVSSMKHSHLTALIHDIEESICSTMVTIVLYRKKEHPNNAVVITVPTKDLSWELMKLRGEGYCSPPDPSEEIKMREGEQFVLTFSGNITSAGGKSNGPTLQRITFHSQRKNRLDLCLKEVDEFGNYCSPHYKGTAIFYKVTKEQIAVCGDIECNLQDPVCKLPLTLPKKERIISRPVSAKVVFRDQSEPLSDALLLWLSEELSEEDAALLVLCLRIRRSSIQLVKLKIPENLPQQIFELLVMWRKSLPASADKISLLSHYLSKCGRSDLAKDLILQERIHSDPEE